LDLIYEKSHDFNKGLLKRSYDMQEKLIDDKYNLDGGNLISLIYNHHVINHLTNADKYYKELYWIYTDQCPEWIEFKQLLAVSLDNCLTDSHWIKRRLAKDRREESGTLKITSRQEKRQNIF
jgi:hypothetical protein